MNLGINLLLWTTHVEEAHLPELSSIRAAGYNGVEIPIHQTDPGHYQWLGARLDDLGLRRTASTALPGPEANLISPEAGSRQAAIDYLRRVIDCVHGLGSAVLAGPLYQALGVFSGSGPSEQERAWAIDGLRDVAGHAEDGGITLCLEPLNRFECHLLNTVEAAATLAGHVDHPALKIMYDSFHANIEEEDLLGPIEPFADWIAHVHISENHRGAPGTGHLPLVDVIHRFEALGYDGWYVVESFGTSLPDLAEATRCWRPTFSSPRQVVEAGIRLLRR